MATKRRLRTATALVAMALGSVGSVVAIPATAALASECYSGALGETGGWAICVSGRYRVVLICENAFSGNNHNVYGPWASNGDASNAYCGSTELRDVIGSDNG